MSEWQPEATILRTVEQLDALPHGAIVTARTGERIFMNREDYTRPLFECEAGGVLYTHNVFAEFGVDHVFMEGIVRDGSCNR